MVRTIITLIAWILGCILAAYFGFIGICKAISYGYDCKTEKYNRSNGTTLTDSGTHI